MSEGDSISVFWGGNHTGIYAGDHPDVEFHGNAVSGTGIPNLEARLAADLAVKATVRTVFVGEADVANDWQYATVDDWAAAMFAYTDKLRATGSKVLLATLLPTKHYDAANSAVFNPLYETRRQAANVIIKRAYAQGRIDGVIDFAADPVMGALTAPDDRTLYQDGTHPTDGCGYGCGGQGRLAIIYRDAVTKALGQ